MTQNYNLQRNQKDKLKCAITITGSIITIYKKGNENNNKKGQTWYCQIERQ